MTVHEGNLFVGRGSPAGVLFWDGRSWEALGSGFFPSWAYALASYGGSLYATGLFQIAGNKPSIYIGRWTANRTGVQEFDSRLTLKVYPNPIRLRSIVVYELEEPSHLRLAVYDVGGRQIAILFEGFQNSGQYSRVWNGRDAAGRQLPAGMYYLELRSESRTVVRKLVVIR